MISTSLLYSPGWPLVLVGGLFFGLVSVLICFGFVCSSDLVVLSTSCFAIEALGSTPCVATYALESLLGSVASVVHKCNLIVQVLTSITMYLYFVEYPYSFIIHGILLFCPLDWLGSLVVLSLHCFTLGRFLLPPDSVVTAFFSAVWHE